MLSHFSHVWLFATLWTVACQVPLSMGSPGKNTGMGSHFLLQGIFLTQGLNLGLPHYRQILYCLSHQGSPKMPSLVIFYYYNTPAIDQQNVSHYFIAQEIIFSILWYPVSCNIPMENNLKKNRYVYICVYAKSLQMCPTLCDPLDSSPIMLLCPRDSPGKNTGVGVCVLLQGIFLTQGLNSCFLWLLHCRQILYGWTTRETHMCIHV